MSGPIQPDLHGVMNALAQGLDDALNGPALPGLPRTKKVAFVLLTANFGQIDNGRVNYISNAERADMIAAVKEWLARIEGRYAETGTAQ